MVVVDGDGRSGRTRQVEDGTVRDQLADPRVGRVRLSDDDQVGTLSVISRSWLRSDAICGERLFHILAVSADEPAEVDAFVVDDDLVTLADQPAPCGRNAARSHSSAINWPIARQEVAAGDGAFRTCMN